MSAAHRARDGIEAQALRLGRLADELASTAGQLQPDAEPGQLIAAATVLRSVALTAGCFAAQIHGKACQLEPLGELGAQVEAEGDDG